LRLEHEQRHADLMARYLGAEPGKTDERAGNDLHSVADPGFPPSTLFVWQVDGAAALASARGVDHLVRNVNSLIVAV
jgi:hypothetical protein